MHVIAYACILASLLACLFGGATAVLAVWNREREVPVWLGRVQPLVLALLTLASLILFTALAGRDFSFSYVAEYSDHTLPMFYTLTAFWAGQAGSLLFWAWMVAIFGVIFAWGGRYKELEVQTRNWFWVFMLAIQGYLFLLLTTSSNPFLEVVPAPADGQGLNPLLQNPGMIFHPPLLFLGYAGFTVPACLALASRLSREPKSWIAATQNHSRVAWMFLSAGIILGAWWSYMELGWGGYWAWDPVENASLIPWLSSTAFLHTAIIESRRGSLAKTNVFLILLTLLLCFFGTYVVRSGVIQSLHAFGGGIIGSQLLVFLIGLLVIGLSVLFVTRSEGEAKELSELMSRQGMLLVVAWIFLALGLVVLLGTTWPVITQYATGRSVGLDAGFYNRTTLPLFVAISLLLAACPWLGWTGGVRSKSGLILSGMVLAGAGIALAALGYTVPLALVGAASALAVLGSILALLVLAPEMRRSRTSLGAYTVHLGLALMVLGVSFSGAYEQTVEGVVPMGGSLNLGGYTFTYKDLTQASTPAMQSVGAVVEVERQGKSLGTMLPERRIYRNFEQPFAEVATIPGLGDELYATLVAVNQDKAASLKVSVHPLVNWIWIGGTILCLAPLLCLRGRKGQEQPSR